MRNSSPQRTRRTQRINPVACKNGSASASSVSSVVAICPVLVLVSQRSAGTAPDEATRLLQEYVRIDTSNPPGDTRKAADFLAGIFEREGIPVTRYESAPGKAIVYARLKATVSPPAGKAIVLLHHMDVVPADRSQWKVDPFGATIKATSCGAAARST